LGKQLGESRGGLLQKGRAASSFGWKRKVVQATAGGRGIGNKKKTYGAENGKEGMEPGERPKAEGGVMGQGKESEESVHRECTFGILSDTNHEGKGKGGTGKESNRTAEGCLCVGRDRLDEWFLEGAN